MKYSGIHVEIGILNMTHELDMKKIEYAKI